jgi:hypothetical protein
MISSPALLVRSKLPIVMAISPWIWIPFSAASLS